MKTRFTTKEALAAELNGLYSAVDDEALELLLGDRATLETVTDLPSVIRRFIADADLALSTFGDESYRKVLVLIGSAMADDELLAGMEAFEDEWWYKPTNYTNAVMVDINYDV